MRLRKAAHEFAAFNEQESGKFRAKICFCSVQFHPEKSKQTPQAAHHGMPGIRLDELIRARTRDDRDAVLSAHTYSFR